MVLKFENKKKCDKSLKVKMEMRANYNKMEYCLGNCFELLSASTVFAVCQDSSVLRTR